MSRVKWEIGPAVLVVEFIATLVGGVSRFQKVFSQHFSI